MRRLICLVIVINFLLISLAGSLPCYAAGAKYELEWDYLIPNQKDRELNTSSIHILKKISETKTRSVYGGITITRPLGHITKQQELQDSSAIGVGPIYMIRNENFHSGKLTGAFEMSGGLIIYNEAFPVGGKPFNFMWRVGPRLIYKFNENSSLNVGYMLMHVSNGFKTHNPSYNARGISLGFTTNF